MTAAIRNPQSAIGSLPGPSSVRQLFDALVCLGVAVILFRAFEVEGYIISTGSMAPHLLGYHKRIACPACGFAFTVGAHDDETTPASGGRQPTGRGIDESGRPTTDASQPGVSLALGVEVPLMPPEHWAATCPNCGQANIDISHVPRNEGDQLLVCKEAFAFRKPRRWEVIVFRNPNRPTQAYVKRVVGLPGEKLQILDGDIFVNGRIQRKDTAQMRAVRIPVFDQEHHPPADDTWQPRWLPDDGWTTTENGFALKQAAAPVASSQKAQPLAWVAYRHWLRRGGRHTSAVPVDEATGELEKLQSRYLPVWYDASQKSLCCRGVLSESNLDRLMSQLDDADLQQALLKLHEESHAGPVTDTYGYNDYDEQLPVRDLMLALNVRVDGGHGEFVLRMADGRHAAVCVFDFQAGNVRLLIDDSLDPVRTAPLPAAMQNRTVLVEMAMIDRQIMVAVDETPLFDPWLDPADGPEADADVPRSPVWFAARRLDLNVDRLQLFRDVHYTSRWDRHGVDEPFQLDEDQYFVLGDNSPVSVDSRAWPQAAVHSRLIVGKPFLVHLPSRPGRIRIGQYDCHIRIPDLSRIRYIR